MASVAHVEDDFEIIERLDQALRGDPCCASERAIEPVLEVMQKTAESLELKGPIFHARMGPTCVFAGFTKALPLEHRQIMNCNNCKRFLRLYGDLCVVGDDGALIPLMWPLDIAEIPPFYQQSVIDVQKLFEGKAVGDEFEIPKGRILGNPTTGEWNHMSLTIKKPAMAPLNRSLYLQDTNTSYQMLSRIIEDNPPEVIARVHHLLHEDQLPYASSNIAPISFLQKTVERLVAQNPKSPVLRTNLITRYAREAFLGWLSSLRSGMLSYLVKYVNKGQDFETLKKNWQRKAYHLSYLGPTSARFVGDIASAEKVIAKLGFKPRDLERVYLTMDQVPKSAILWTPTGFSPTPAFSYSDAPIQNITFRHFVNKILPAASTIHALPDNKIRPYFFTTGREGCKPIMNFHKQAGHTASWYTWGAALWPGNAGLKWGTFTRVLGIVGFPHMWDSYDFSDPTTAFDEAKFEAFTQKLNGLRFLIVLEGAREQRENLGLCLFPTLMRGEFHGVRRTVEEFNQWGRIEDPEAGKSIVGGFGVSKSQEKTDFVIGVTMNTGMAGRYRITLFE